MWGVDNNSGRVLTLRVVGVVGVLILGVIECCGVLT